MPISSKKSILLPAFTCDEKKTTNQQRNETKYLKRIMFTKTQPFLSEGKMLLFGRFIGFCQHIGNEIIINNHHVCIERWKSQICTECLKSQA